MNKLANNPQTIKRIRQNEKRRQLQQGQITEMRTAKKKFLNAVENNDSNTQELFNNAISKIDQAAGKGHIHGNKAAREKSRLQAKLAD